MTDTNLTAATIHRSYYSETAPVYAKTADGVAFTEVFVAPCNFAADGYFVTNVTLAHYAGLKKARRAAATTASGTDFFALLFGKDA